MTNPVSVFVDGEPVADLWGGYRDAKRTEPWEPDTITNVWSTAARRRRRRDRNPDQRREQCALRMSVAYVMNQMLQPPQGSDSRGPGILLGAYDGLG